MAIYRADQIHGRSLVEEAFDQSTTNAVKEQIGDFL